MTVNPGSRSHIKRRSGSAKSFAVAIVADLLLYTVYRLWLNPSGLLDSDDHFYFDLAETSIQMGYSPFLHLADLNRAIVFIIQVLFETFRWDDPSLFVCFGIGLYWFSAYKLFGRHASFGFIIPLVLLLYPDLMYVRYHLFKDIILVSLIALFIHYYEQRRLALALTAALLCAPFRFYLFPLVVLCVVLLNIRKFSLWHFVAAGVLVFAFMSQIDIVTIASSTFTSDVFASGGDYTVKRVADALGISSPFLLMPFVTLSFFLQPSPVSIIDSGFDSIVPFSFLATYFLLVPVLINILRSKRLLKGTGLRSIHFIFLFVAIYVLTFAFNPVLADMRHRVILILPILIVFFRLRWARRQLYIQAIPSAQQQAETPSGMRVMKVAPNGCE